MRILFCNPKNSQGTTHSRKGMYVPLGILSIATVLKEEFGGRVEVTVCDEDVDDIGLFPFENFDLVGFYSTTFNYKNCVLYAAQAKECGAVTVLGGPHGSILADNIMNNRHCFDFIIRFEAEVPFARLVDYLLNKKTEKLVRIPNLVYRSGGRIVSSGLLYENDLQALPIPSRDFIDLNSYTGNFRKLYPEKKSIIPGSIYSSKGCSWRDRTGGCVFCARLEKGVRFRDADQVWAEIQLLRNRYGINSIWDISDDNLNNIEWLKMFVRKKPVDCRDMPFFIYSRVNFINDKTIRYLQELNVEEVFLGIESGDDAILKNSFKGQTVATIMRAVRLLKKGGIKYFPSFILGLPGETEESAANTLKLCRQISELGGLYRLGCTILQPMPGSRAFDKLLKESKFGPKLKSQDDTDIASLEKYWLESFTGISYEAAAEYRKKINETMTGCMVFGGEKK